MKEPGILLSPRKFSSLKYDMTCVVCFQKFIISYAALVLAHSSASPPNGIRAGVIPGTQRVI